MRYLTYNPFRPPFACFLRANSAVMSTQRKRQRLSTRWADSRPLRRVFLTTVTPPLEKQHPTQTRDPLAPTFFGIQPFSLPRTKDSIPIGPSLARGLVQLILSSAGAGNINVDP